MRDLSRASGMSLAGLYYYFESKERLLFLIQKHTFTTIVQRLKTRLEGVDDPEQQIRIFILNHLEYFLANQQHEGAVARGGCAEKRIRLRSCCDQARILPHLCGTAGGIEGGEWIEFSTRIAVLSLFGMMNWIYTWHNPRVDADAEQIAREMGDIFLRGVINGKGKQVRAAKPDSRLTRNDSKQKN